MTKVASISEIRVVRFLVCLSFVFLFSGCGAGNGQGLDENGNLIGEDGGGGDNGSGGTGASGNPNATLAWLQANIFGGICTQCHTGAGAPLGVDWSSESASCSNVGRTSGEIPTMLEVESGNPDASYVIWKVDGAGPNGEAIVGAQMPLSNPPLTAEAIQNIRDWISDGTPGCQAQQSTGSANTPAVKADITGRTTTRSASKYPVGSWPYVWEETMQNCATCHSINPSSPACLADLQCPPHGVVLTIDNYFGLVNGVDFAPFDPGSSEFWRQITEEDPHQRMPFGVLPLSTPQKNIIYSWITDGAPLCLESANCL